MNSIDDKLRPILADVIRRNVREGDLVHQRGSGEGWASDGDV